MNTTIKTPRRVSVSSWSLHRTLGAPAFYGVGQEIPTASHNSSAVSLLELPAKLKAFGINTMEICHFHLPSRDEEYLHQLRAALDENGIELWSFLIDEGDITHPENGERDAQWIADWFPVAEKLGAQRVRIIAGKGEPTDENIQRSAQQLQKLAQKAKSHNLRVMTENWFNLLSTPNRVLELFAKLNGELGLCLDFGNWGESNKYERLAQIAHLAQSCHAKAEFFDENTLNEDDYTRCLDLLKNADFSGPYTLINGTPGDEWSGLEMEKEVVERYLS